MIDYGNSCAYVIASTILKRNKDTSYTQLYYESYRSHNAFALSIIYESLQDFNFS